MFEDKLKDVNISNVMTTWTKQKGHPVVTIRSINSTHVAIRQNRFIFDSTYPLNELNE